MPYAVEADCRLHAPQAAAADDFAGYITQADAVVDSRLRSYYDLPFDPVPQLITNIVSRLAAGRYLEAKYGAINQEPPDHAGNLISGAIADLEKIVEEPGLLDYDRREVTPTDLLEDPVLVSDRDHGMFDSADPRTWGPKW